MSKDKYVVHKYDSWTEWYSLVGKVDTHDGVIYSGPITECTIDEIKQKHNNAKYIVVTKEK